MKKLFNVLLAVVILTTVFCSCSKAIKDVSDDITLSVAETSEITVISKTELMTEQTTLATTAITTQQDVTATKKQTTNTTTKRAITTEQQATTKIETTTSGCASGNHSMGVGNIGRWFNSRSEVQAYVNSVMANWGNKYHNGEITWEEYTKNCPQGYKAWSCSSCGKWMGNFTY